MAQQKASGRNETAGALKVLDLLSREGCIVAADALHCTRAFASAVRDRRRLCSGDRGQPRAPVHRGTQQFARSGKRSTAEQIDPSTHDRREVQRTTIMRRTSLVDLYGFLGAPQ